MRLDGMVALITGRRAVSAGHWRWRRRAEASFRLADHVGSLVRVGHVERDRQRRCRMPCGELLHGCNVACGEDNLVALLERIFSQRLDSPTEAAQMLGENRYRYP